MAVAGNFFTTVTGKLTEIIEGDVVSESKKGRKEYSAGEMEIGSESAIKKHAQKQVNNNSGEQSNSH